MMKRANWWIALMAMLTLVVAGCGLPGDDEAEPDLEPEAVDDDPVEEDVDEPADEEPILIGTALPLTGAFADTGVFVRDGYEAWVEEINDEGGLLGRPVELTVIDDTSDPGRSSALLERLITQDNVDLVLGGYPGSSAAAQMAVAEQHGKVYVSMGGHLSSFEQGFTYSFGAPPLMGEWWYQGFFDFLETLPEDERPSTAAMITINNPVGAAVRNGSHEDLERLGIEVVMDELYDVPLAEAESLIGQAQRSGAELFISNSFFPDGVLSIRAVHAVGYQPMAILQGIGTLIPAWEEELGEEGEHIISGTAMHPGLPFEGIDEVNEMAQDRYGTPQAPIYFQFGATWAQVLALGVEGAGTLEDDAIRDWLRDNEVSTLGGTFTFDERGLPEPYSFVTQVINGVPELVWPPDVATTDIVYPFPWE
jgi:branched-chain amino acid transport system substrate-binding protein